MKTTTYDSENYFDYIASMGLDLTRMSPAEREQVFVNFLVESQCTEDNNG